MFPLWSMLFLQNYSDSMLIIIFAKSSAKMFDINHLNLFNSNICDDEFLVNE